MAHSPHLCRPSRVSSDHVSHRRWLLMAPPMRGFATHVRRGCTRSSPCIPATFCLAAATRRVCALAAKLCVQTKWHALPTHGVFLTSWVQPRATTRAMPLLTPQSLNVACCGQSADPTFRSKCGNYRQKKTLIWFDLNDRGCPCVLFECFIQGPWQTGTFANHWLIHVGALHGPLVKLGPWKISPNTNFNMV